MTYFHLENDPKALRRLRWRSLSVVMAMALLLGTTAFPLPGFVDYLRLCREMSASLDRRQMLPALEREVHLLRAGSTDPRIVKKRVGEAFPEVESLFVLRNLFLAQAEAAHVSVETLEASPPVPADPALERIGTFEVDLKGSARMESLLLLLGFMDATGLAYKVDSLNVSFSLEEDGKVSFGLKFEVFFSSDRELAGMSSAEGKRRPMGSEGEPDALQP